MAVFPLLICSGHARHGSEKFPSRRTQVREDSRSMFCQDIVLGALRLWELLRLYDAPLGGRVLTASEMERRESEIMSFPVTPSPSTSPKVLPWILRTWEEHCSPNVRSAARQTGGVLQIQIKGLVSLSNSSVSRGREGLQCKLEVFCSAHWRCTAILLLTIAGVWTSETLLIQL